MKQTCNNTDIVYAYRVRCMQQIVWCLERCKRPNKCYCLFKLFHANKHQTTLTVMTNTERDCKKQVDFQHLFVTISKCKALVEDSLLRFQVSMSCVSKMSSTKKAQGYILQKPLQTYPFLCITSLHRHRNIGSLPYPRLPLIFIWSHTEISFVGSHIGSLLDTVCLVIFISSSIVSGEEYFPTYSTPLT